MMGDAFDRAGLIDLAELPDAAQDFDAFLREIRDRFGVDHVAYAGMNPINRSVVGHVTYGEDWQEHYATQGFHRIDPTLHSARRSIAPVDWSRLERDLDYLTVFRSAHDFGISDQGVTIPVRGPYGDIGGLSLTCGGPKKEWKALCRENLHLWQALSVHVHDLVISSDSFSSLLRGPSMSLREREILQWTAEGKSQQDIADILAISHRTVEVHLRSARHKLYALTTAQAVGRAISMGLIYPG
ncbi:MAG: LuxR family transcriptional regulator [Roseovarius sp.]